LSPQNSAADLMKLFPNGEKVFAVISRYSEITAKEIWPLIVPSLILHNIREENIVDLAAKAVLTGGALNLVSKLEYNSWKIYFLTAVYEQYAFHIAQKFGIYSHHIACTPFR
jgi:predicted HAD superfamily phosphohydrolase